MLEPEYARRLGLFIIASTAPVIRNEQGVSPKQPPAYSVRVRITRAGWAIGIGRIRFTVSPAFAGLLFAAGWATAAIYRIYALPRMLGLVLMLLIVLPAHTAQMNAGSVARRIR